MREGPPTLRSVRGQERPMERILREREPQRLVDVEEVDALLIQERGQGLARGNVEEGVVEADQRAREVIVPDVLVDLEAIAAHEEDAIGAMEGLAEGGEPFVQRQQWAPARSGS